MKTPTRKRVEVGMCAVTNLSFAVRENGKKWVMDDGTTFASPPPRLTVEGVDYDFVSWSDYGCRWLYRRVGS